MNMNTLGWKLAGWLYGALQAIIILLLAMILNRFDRLEQVDNNHETRISVIEGRLQSYGILTPPGK
jgi:cytidylate kinase